MGRHWVVRTALLMAATACTRAPSTGVPALHADTTWYISARARDGGRDTKRLADSLEYGFVITERPMTGDPSMERLSPRLVDSLRLSAVAFTEMLRDRLHASASTDPAAVFYVHGFGTSLHEAWAHAVQAQIRSRSRGPWVVFCWPSNGRGIDWPRRGQLFDRAYRDDSTSAAASRAAFALATHRVLDAVGAPALMLLTHSMGAQVAGETLASDSALRARLLTTRLRAAAFFAPDVSVERFTRSTVPSTVPLAERVVLYASSNDRLLAISRRVNNAERAGLLREAGDGLLVAQGLESVDITRGIAAENAWQRTFGSHHALRRSSAVLFDFMYLVGGRFPPSCRETLGTGTAGKGGTWSLTPIVPPSPASLQRCTR